MNFDYALIDADIVAYEAARLGTTEVDWGDGEFGGHTVIHNFEESKRRFSNEVRRILLELGNPKPVMCVSCFSREYWRHDIYPKYKRNRSSSTPPELVMPVKEWVSREYYTLQWKHMEADDVLGILATGDQILDGNKIIVSVDKDMRQIPGWLMNPRNAFAEPEEISLEQADRWHMQQTLMGDSVDGFPGVPGIGPKKAVKFIDEDGTWEGVFKLFESKGISREDALVQAQIARICRASDYDWFKSEVKLWEPTTK